MVESCMQRLGRALCGFHLLFPFLVLNIYGAGSTKAACELFAPKENNVRVASETMRRGLPFGSGEADVSSQLALAVGQSA